MLKDDRQPPLTVGSSIRRIAGNVISLLTSDIMNRATTFLLYALVARYLGLFEFGQLSLALMFFYMFQVFAAAGLKTLITREVARDKTKTDSYLVNGSITVFVFSLISIIVQVLFVGLMDYDRDTTAIILLSSLGLIPYTLSSICEAIFQAWERMRYIAYANLFSNVAKLVLAFLLLSLGYGLYPLIALLIVCYVSVVSFEWYLILQNIIRPTLKPDFYFSISMIQESIPFLGIESVIAIWSSLNVLLLSKLGNEADVGLYYAAGQILIPVSLILQSLVSGIFPIMCRKFDVDLQNLKQIYKYMIEALLFIAVPAAVGLFYLAEPILLLLYGDRTFLQAAKVLRIIAWALIPMALTRALGQVLLASLHEKITLRIVIINTLISLVLGLILIGPFGIVGAAIAGLIAQLINVLQHYISVSKIFSNIALGQIAWKAIVASLCMAAYLSVVGDILGLWLIILTAALIYTSSWIALMIWTNGGIGQFKARYLYLWSK